MGVTAEVDANAAGEIAAAVDGVAKAAGLSREVLTSHYSS